MSVFLSPFFFFFFFFIPVVSRLQKDSSSSQSNYLLSLTHTHTHRIPLFRFTFALYNDMYTFSLSCFFPAACTLFPLSLHSFTSPSFSSFLARGGGLSRLGFSSAGSALMPHAYFSLPYFYYSLPLSCFLSVVHTGTRSFHLLRPLHLVVESPF